MVEFYIDRDKQSHLDQAKELGVEGIDLVCVNLYPFKATIEKTMILKRLLKILILVDQQW